MRFPSNGTDDSDEHRLQELGASIVEAIAGGKPPMEAAIRKWEQLTGTRSRLNVALLALFDLGGFKGKVEADGSGYRKVLLITDVSEERKPIEVEKRSRIVFVVHGKDLALKRSMFEFLRSIDLHPLEWSELLSDSEEGSPYIGHVVNSAFDRAQAVVVLLTPDERVQLVERLGGGQEGFQSRPNVHFEAGLSFARNSARTILVEVGGLRPFSDVAGRASIRLDDRMPDKVAKRQMLADRLRRAGCAVSLVGTDWHDAGRFIID